MAAPPDPAISTAEPSASATALLIIDMISDWTFPDAEHLLPRAVRIAPAIAALKRRCRKSGVPVIYANDNRGRWRSDFRQVVEWSLQGPGAAITRALMPDDHDYFVLKPKHSAFFDTPLDLLLRNQEVDRLVLTGVATDQCIVTTAVDARMRDYDVEAPADCTATQSDEREARMLAHFAEALCVPTPRAADVEFERPERDGKRQSG
jgi:nicotinamidase-related amidase